MLTTTHRCNYNSYNGNGLNKKVPDIIKKFMNGENIAMKKIMLTSVLSLGTLMSVNLPGLDYMTVHAASPSKINVTDSSYSQQVLLEKQYQKQTGTIIEKNEGQLTLSKGNLTI
ncbi:hypothetical protein FC695_30690, partial [Bacillus cereus]